MMSRRTCFILPGSCHCVFLQAVLRLPSAFFLGAVQLFSLPLTIPSRFLSFLVLFFLVLSSWHSPSSTRYPVPFRTVLPSSFPSADLDILREWKTLRDQSRKVSRSVRQSGPSQRFPQGGCWPNFPTRSPGGVSGPRGRPPVLSFPPGEGRWRRCTPPPPTQAQFTGWQM
jgi:hypothetical protein